MAEAKAIPKEEYLDPSWSKRRRWVYLAFAALSLLALSSTWKVSMEDAYITYTYARNLAEGSGFVFNEGEYVFGTTTPLYTLLLAGLGGIAGTSHIPEISSLLSCLGLFMQAALFYEFFRRHQLAAVGGIIGLGILLNLTEAYWYTGMETNLLAGFLVLLVWLLFAADRPIWGGLAAGIIVLFRYDGVVFVACAYLVWILGAGKKGVKGRMITTAVAAGIGILVIVPWIVYAWQRFGSPMPTALGAKQGHHSPLVYTAFQLVRLGQFVDTYARPHSSLYLAARFLRNVVSFPEVLAVWTLAFVGWIQLSRRKGWPHFLLVFPFVFIGALSVLGPPLTHAWHIYPAQLCFFALIVMGACSVWTWMHERTGEEGTSWRGQLLRSGLHLVVVVFVGSLLWSSIGFQKRVATEMWFGPREAAYGRMVDYLNQRTRSGSTVLHAEVGYIGFHTRCRMIDRVGLITPELQRPGHAELEDLATVVGRLRPDYFVVRPNDRESVRKCPDYALVVDAGSVSLYGRKDL